MSEVFGLRAFHGKVFKIADDKCYDDQIVVQIQDGSKWLDFSRGTQAELDREKVKLYCECTECKTLIEPNSYGLCDSCFKSLQQAESSMGC